MHQQELLKRLSFIRYLFSVGDQQCGTSLPYSSVSILSFHDCVEWFLITACEYIGVNTPRSAGIYDYFDRLERHSPSKISGKMTLHKLTAARDQFKHRLTIPSTIALQEIRFGTKNFLEENSLSLFSVDFNEVSMIDLVGDEQIKQTLSRAKTLIEKSEHQLAIRTLSEAFDDLRRKFRLNLMPHWTVVCGADEVALWSVVRHFPQTGDLDPPSEWMTTSKKTCEFIHELIVETTIKVEQTFSGRWEKIDELLQDARGPHDLHAICGGNLVLFRQP